MNRRSANSEAGATVTNQGGATGDPTQRRGYIQPHTLDELWFHTGTACNLACPFCLEGSKPGDNRLQRITLADAQPFVDEALELGVKQFSFTGGEPFVVRQFVDILEYAASKRPCLVLTNGTEPLLKRLKQLERLQRAPHAVSFRISIDWPDRQRHERGRGEGTFDQSLRSIAELRQMGFGVSLARQIDPNENTDEVDSSYRTMLRSLGVDSDVRIVSFPDFSTPGQNVEVPRITEDCMTRYHDADSRQRFMCAFSKMVIKKNGRMRVYACTLVDDDEFYDQGSNLRSALQQRVKLRHHRCYTCFANGASCSEL